MARILYCWRCKTDVPMLEEHEWDDVSAALTEGISEIQHYRRQHGASVKEARDHVYWQGGFARYRELTGYSGSDPEVVWHHRLSLLGPLCHACGKPLRTPRASFCAGCGTKRSA
jgi:hypothetical protein